MLPGRGSIRTAWPRRWSMAAAEAALDRWPDNAAKADVSGTRPSAEEVCVRSWRRGLNVPILLSVTGSPRDSRFKVSALTQPFQARHQPLSVSPVTLLQLGQKTVFHLARACPPHQVIAFDLVPGLDVSQGRERVLQVGQEVVGIEPDVGFVGLSGHDSLPHELTRSCSCGVNSLYDTGQIPAFFGYFMAAGGCPACAAWPQTGRRCPAVVRIS